MTTLAHDLHLLVALMDRRAEALLAGSKSPLTYRRFLTLVLIAEHDRLSQRELADRLGVSEPAASRMVATLADAGFIGIDQGPGRRRALRLTAGGEAALGMAAGVLGDSFDRLVRDVGFDPDLLRSGVGTLIAALRELQS